MAQHNQLGKWGEEISAEYLIEKGYIIREKDWRCGKRDIDLIAITADLTTVVFVEVKTRKTKDIISPEDAVTKQKIRNIAIAAKNYIKMFNIEQEVRFDIIAITGTCVENAEIKHIENAFNPLLI